MKICKVYPPLYICRMCVDTWESMGEGRVDLMPDCKTCHYTTDEYELIQIINSFWGTYALVLKDGKIQKVGIDKVHDIKEVSYEN